MFKFFRQIIFYGLLILLWQFLFSLKLWPQYLLPSPEQVFQALKEGMNDGSFLLGTLVSLRRLAIGYALSVTFGVSLGLLIGKFEMLDETVTGLFTALQTLPSICWLPFAMLWFGMSEASIIFVVVIGSILSITIATESGVKNIPVLYLRTGRNMGARGYSMFRCVILPAALPSILIGLKQGWIFAWRSLMAGEIIFTSLGLGYLLNNGRQLNDM